MKFPDPPSRKPLFSACRCGSSHRSWLESERLLDLLLVPRRPEAWKRPRPRVKAMRLASTPRCPRHPTAKLAGEARKRSGRGDGPRRLDHERLVVHPPSPLGSSTSVAAPVARYSMGTNRGRMVAARHILPRYEYMYGFTIGRGLYFTHQGSFEILRERNHRVTICGPAKAIPLQYSTCRQSGNSHDHFPYQAA